LETNLLKIINLKTHFFTSKGIVKAVDGINLDINLGESVGLVGESGSGKSVTATSIMRLVPSPPGKIVDGSIYFHNEDLLKKTEDEMRKIRGNKIAMCFQDPMTFLNPVMRVGDQIAEAILMHNDVDKKEAHKMAIEAMEKVLISSASVRALDYPHNFSGGMRQRILIASALSCNPDLIIADEPTTSLDVITQADMLDLFIELKSKINSSLLLISHDLGIVAQTCDHIFVMYNGKVLESGSIREIFKDPLHPYTEGLLESLPRIHGKIRRKLRAIPGMIPNPVQPPSGCRFHPRCQYVMDVCRTLEPETVEMGERRMVACHKVNPPKN
jgi:oligopeptide/dipeptide ABC transporter ATP-binding protein